MEEPKTIRLIEDRWTVIRHAVEAIAIVAAGIWAFYVFIYQERIKPALEPPSLELNLDFDRGTIVRGVRVANLVVTVHNTGHSDVSFVATAFSAWTAVPGTLLTAAQAGHLAEDVNGSNIETDGFGIVTGPADITSSATGNPIGIVYDYDGAVTDALFGEGAGGLVAGLPGRSGTAVGRDRSRPGALDLA